MPKDIADIPGLVNEFYVDDELLDKIDELYPCSKTAYFTTKNGEWIMHERKNFSIPFFMDEEIIEPSNGICGVYYSKERGRRLFLGELGEEKPGQLENKLAFYTTALELTGKCFEQGRFSRPPRDLTSGQGEHHYTLRNYKAPSIINKN